MTLTFEQLIRLKRHWKPIFVYYFITFFICLLYLNTGRI